MTTSFSVCYDGSRPEAVAAIEIGRTSARHSNRHPLSWPFANSRPCGGGDVTSTGLYGYFWNIQWLANVMVEVNVVVPLRNVMNGGPDDGNSCQDIRNRMKRMVGGIWNQVNRKKHRCFNVTFTGPQHNNETSRT